MQDVPDKLILAFLEGGIDDAQAQALSQWVLASKDNARYLASLTALEQGLVRHTRLQSNRDILAQLNADEDQDLSTPAVPQIQWTYQTRTSSHNKTLGLIGYVGRQSLRRHAAALSGIAAVLILTLIAVFVFRGAPDEDTEPQLVADDPAVAQETDEPVQAPIPSAYPAVATLTAMHDAQWAEGASAPGSLTPGSNLHPNQRLTLTQGFAEITTNRGAVAVLQAPATIEFTDDDNTIRLHAGKLVGICETDASKGFWVHTPHMDITDLGTRFGINADADATEVHVFEGKVQAERVDATPGTEPTLLVANQSARTSADTDVITRIDHDTDRFAALLPTTTQLAGTGHGLAVGDTDPNWQIVAIDGKPLDAPQTLRVTDNPRYTRDVPNDPAIAQWIGVQPSQQPQQPNSAVTFRIQTRVSLPDSIAPEAARLALSYTADNHVRAILVNGRRIERDDPIDQGNWTVRDLVLDEHLIAGENSIAFEVENWRLAGTGSAGGLALYVRWAWEQPVVTTTRDRVGNE